MSRHAAQAGSLGAPAGGDLVALPIGPRGVDARERRAVAPGAGVRLLYAGMGLALVAYLVLLAIRPAGQDSTVIDGWGVDVFELLAGALCIIGGRRRRPGSV